MKIFLQILIFVISSSFFKTYAQTGELFYKISDSLYRDKNYALAKQSYTKTMSFYQDRKPLLSLLLMYRSRCERQLNQFKDAIADVDSAITLNSKNRDAYWDRALIYSDLKKYELAIKDFTTAIPFYKNNDEYLSRIYDGRAKQEYYLKDYKNSLNDDSIALKINPENGSAYWHRGTTFHDTKNYKRAIVDYTAALAYHLEQENWASLYFNRGNCQQDLENYLKAINDYNQAINLNPAKENYYFERGRTYSKNGDYQLATEDFTKAISFQPKDTNYSARIYYNIGMNEINLLQYQKGIEDLNKAIDLNPNNGAYYFLVGNAFSSLGDFKLSTVNYLKAITLAQNNKPFMAAIYDACANNDFFLKDYQRVIDDATFAVSLNPTLSSSYYYRARALTKSGKDKKAIIDFKKIIEIDTTRKTSGYIFSLHYLGDDIKAVKLMNDRILAARNDYDRLNEYYNMACLFSLMKKATEANTYLKLAIDGGYSKKYALEDDDLAYIQQTKEFLTITGNM